MSRLKPHERVTLEEAKRRALVFLSNQPHRNLPLASGVGAAIWPDNNMHAQGLGFAASRILKMLRDDGLVEWRWESLAGYENNGYAITASGRKWVKDNA